MILLHDFQKLVEPYLREAHCHNQVFLHFLFPGNISFPELAAKRILNDAGSYQKVAILGYQLALGRECFSAFRFACTQLMGTDLSKGFLVTDEVALLGIALGMRKLREYPKHRNTEWERKLLGIAFSKPELYDFIKGILRGLPRMAVGQEFPEYSLYLTIAAGERPPEWSTKLKQYFIENRKQPYLPEGDDFLVANLRLYILDVCYRECIWEVEMLEEIRRNTVSKFQENLCKMARHRGKRWAVLVYTTALLGLAAVSIGFFSFLWADPVRKSLWDTLAGSLLLVGGPVSLFLLLLKAFGHFFGKKRWLFELAFLEKEFAGRIYQRLRKKLGLPKHPAPS